MAFRPYLWHEDPIDNLKTDNSILQYLPCSFIIAARIYRVIYLHLWTEEGQIRKPSIYTHASEDLIGILSEITVSLSCGLAKLTST